MRIGIDFDNTIVCYDDLFHRLAVERGLIGPDAPRGKSSVRDALRRSGRESDWTKLQGEAYGPRIREAAAFTGILYFLKSCRTDGIHISIISHKTRHPFVGERHNLHAAAYGWLAGNGFFTADAGLSPDDVFLEEMKEAKLARIASLGCSHFIDDLPEILLHPAFPPAVQRVLFDPAHLHADGPYWRSLRSWSDAAGLLLQKVMT